MGVGVAAGGGDVRVLCMWNVYSYHLSSMYYHG